MFFAFESLLVLIYFNISHGMENAALWSHIISWLLLSGSAVLALSGFVHMRKYGMAREDWEDTTRLIHEGVFRYVRHPLYSSLMMLSAGLLLKRAGTPSFIAFLVCITALVAASLAEEGENREKFGESYLHYAQGTKRYIPFVL
jgi:protein-S-isoprenylcysteine O-methyltransferase Ste14